MRIITNTDNDGYEAKDTLRINDDGTFEVTMKYYNDDAEQTVETFNPENSLVEETFGVTIKDEKIIGEPISQRGMGQGAGETTKGMARHLIQKIIDEISPEKAYIKAKENQNPEYQDGHAFVNLISGNFFGYGMAYNTSNQACDNNEVELYRVDQNNDSGWKIYDADNLSYFVEEHIQEQEKYKDIDFDDDVYAIATEAEKIDPELFNYLRNEYEEAIKGMLNIGDFNQDVQKQLNAFYCDIKI